MIIQHISVFLICVVRSNQTQWHEPNKFNIQENAKGVPGRLLRIMQSYYEEAHNRIMEMNDMRFMYEETSEYEQGYIVGEIIERYRKVVELTHAVYNYQSYQAFMILRNLEHIQKLYFEVYHLVRMMHEIPQKYAAYEELGAASKMTPEQKARAKWNAKMLEKKRRKEKRKRLKMYADIRKKYLEAENRTKYVGYLKTPYNTRWPIDYGWEFEDRKINQY